MHFFVFLSEELRKRLVSLFEKKSQPTKEMVVNNRFNYLF